MKEDRWKFLKHLPIILAAIVSIAVIWLESSANNGQGGCLSMLVLAGWAFAGLVTSGD